MFYFLFLLLACRSEESPSQKADTKQQIEETTTETDIDVDTLFNRTEAAKKIIIDVRTPEEYAQGHIIGAKNIPIDKLESRLQELSIYKDQEIYLVCAVGGRSHKARVFLTQKGFSKAINVQGGTRGWKAKGYPTK